MVIDTMVFAYFLLGVEPFRDAAAQVLETVPAVFVPDSLPAELSNVMWQWVTQRPVYDTLFVAVAERRKVRVVTFDKTLATRFPEHVVTAESYLQA